VSRLFWVAVGVAGAYYASRWIKKQRQRLSPEAIGASLGDVVADAAKLFGAAAAEARRAAAEKEAELRGLLDT
jgi:hypothetical protein